ncbi:hypothetical protein ACQKFG_09045 [Peribacillus sp. NPDC076916]|uniref:hypothetical protein n=1 Tax=Peribacillus TaxID=2675229 RepID=UPI0032E37C38
MLSLRAIVIKEDLDRLMYFYIFNQGRVPNQLEEFATQLPNNWQAETPLDAFGEKDWQTVCGKGADF